jgi:hypothetical protein
MLLYLFQPIYSHFVSKSILVDFLYKSGAESIADLMSTINNSFGNFIQLRFCQRALIDLTHNAHPLLSPFISAVSPRCTYGVHPL